MKKVFMSAVDNLVYRFIKDALGNTIAEIECAADKNLEQIYIPNSVENIPVASIAAGAFMQMRKLREVYIETSSSLTVNNSAFSLCPSLEKVESYTDNLILHKKAFFDNPSLAKFFNYGNLHLVGGNIFFKCSNLEKIHGKIKSIHAYALSGATGLKKICFAQEAEIHPDAFNGCNLNEIWFTGNATLLDSTNKTIFKECRILCVNSSNMADLAYDGYDIELTSSMNALNF